MDMYIKNRSVCSHVPRKYVLDTQLLLFILLLLLRCTEFTQSSFNTAVSP